MAMTAGELAVSLRKVYTSTPRGDKTLRVHLWSIEYADELAERGKVNEVVRLAMIGDWVAAINDAKKLAKYVMLRM